MTGDYIIYSISCNAYQSCCYCCKCEHLCFPPYCCLFWFIVFVSVSDVGKDQVCSCGCCCPDPEYYKCCAHCFFSSFCFWFVLFVLVCFPCCDYIIPCFYGLFNEQINSIMLVKQQKCDTVSHKQRRAAELVQFKAVPAFCDRHRLRSLFMQQVQQVLCSPILCIPQLLVQTRSRRIRAMQGTV